MDDISSQSQKPRRRIESAAGGRLLLGYAFVIAGAVMLGVGWYGVSGQPVVAAQLAYLISGGLGGLLAGVIGVGLLVSYDVRRDRERLGRVEAAMLEIRELLVTQGLTGAQPDGGSRDGAGRGPAAGPRPASEPEEAAG